jgi:prepilin-type N-terminal cleavage/methylation domain-containing protein
MPNFFPPFVLRSLHSGCLAGRRSLRSGRRALRAGFTLIELLAVILIIGILMTFLLPKLPEYFDHARVLACKKNMQEIYSGLLMYDNQHGDLPRGSGVKFFAALIADKVWDNGKTSAQKLSCPGVKRSALAGIANLDNPEDWYVHLDQIDGSYSAYAGRNMKDFPLRKFPGGPKEALVADDNDPQMNHRTATVVLFADGSIATFEIAELQKAGTVPEEQKDLIVGPDSPVEELRKLSLD